MTIKHLRTGAVLVLQHLPFEHAQDQTLQQEQQRIATEALHLTQEAAEFLAAEIESCAGWPTTAEHTCGAAPHENEPPNAFGFPMTPA